MNRGTLVAELENGPDNATIVSTIIAIAGALKMSMGAGGVETVGPVAKGQAQGTASEAGREPLGG